MAKSKILFIGGAITVIILTVMVMASHMATKHPQPQSMAASAQQAASTNKVNISNFMFSPMAINVKAGTTVTWTNTDSVHHSVIADNGSKDAPNGPLIGQGEHYSFTFNKRGTYSFHCGPHPYMHGTVVVT